jgi:glycosyltransferase involved in cell wall biosynthesis
MTAIAQQNHPVATPARRTHIAVVIPCHNEELTIANVVREFRAALPEAAVFVCDNNSSDRTVDEAKRAGAIILEEKRQGKGYAVQTLFRRVDADIYVMVDGDGTYPAAAVHSLIDPVLRGEADMVIGSRLTETSRSDFRWLNRFGNHAFLRVLQWIFGVRLTDLLSGYRAFSRRLVKGTPLFGGGFETEVEITIKSLQRRFEVREVPVDLSARPAGSSSKIRVVRDGIIILSNMLALFRDYRPLAFFGTAALLLWAAGFALGAVVVVEFVKTGFIGRMPSAILAVGLVLAGLINFIVGVILHTIAQRFREVESQLQAIADRRGGWRGEDEPPRT